MSAVFTSIYNKMSSMIGVGHLARCLPLLVLLLLTFPLTAFADGGFPIVGVLHEGRSPEGIAVDTQTHLVYSAYEFSGMVVAFDPVSGKVRWQVRTGDTATDVQVDSISHRVYVTGATAHGRQGVLTLLDGLTGRVLLVLGTGGTGPSDGGLAIDAGRGLIYVASSADGAIDAFSLATNPQTGALSAGPSVLYVGQHPSALGVNSRLGRLYVGDATSNVVSVVDEDSGRVIASIPVGADPVQPLRVDEASGRVYVVCSLAQELDVIDGHSNKVIARVPVFPYPEGVAFNTATGRIYVADEGNNETSNRGQNSGTTITVIDGQTFAVLGTLQVGYAPDGVEADPALHRVYVAVENSDALVEISDSVDLPLAVDGSYAQLVAAHHAIAFLQTAGVLTLIVLLATMVVSTLVSKFGRGRATSFRG